MAGGDPHREPLAFDAAYGEERPIRDGGRRIADRRVGRMNGRDAWVSDLPDVADGRRRIARMETQRLEIPYPLADLDVSLVLTEAVRAGQYLRVTGDGIRAMNSFAPDLVLLGPAGDERLPEVHRYRREEMQGRWAWYIRHLPLVTVRVPHDLPVGTRLGARGPASVAPVERMLRAQGAGESDLSPLGAGAPYAGLAWRYCLRVAADTASDEWRQVSDWRGVELVAGPPTRLEAFLRPGGRLAVQHTDRFGNPVTPDARSVALAPDDAATAGAGSVADVPLAPETGATVVALSGPAATAMRVAVRDDRGRVAVSSPRPVGIAGQPIFFGEFHWHAAFSGDG